MAIFFHVHHKKLAKHFDPAYIAEVHTTKVGKSRRKLSIRCAQFAMVCNFLMLGGCCAEALYEAETPNPQVRLPADEAPHCYGAEWWYYSGRLRADNENSYGVHAVIFHVPHIALFGLSDAWMGHYAVLDEGHGAFAYSQVRIFDATQPSPSGEGFALTTPVVQMSGGSGADHLQAQMNDGSFALKLSLADEGGPVLHGTNGYVPFGDGDASFYYSRPRMRAIGSLEIDGQLHPVSGELWFDRQWGRDLNDPWLRWNWFSVRLGDGTDIMLFEFPESELALGTYVPTGGERRSLGPGDFSIQPQSYWRSDRTGATYPVRWNVQIPVVQLSLSISADADNQEIDARPTTFNIYWEGLCSVEGVGNDHQSIDGFAFVEMANYAR